MKHSAIERACKHLGSQSALAASLGLQAATVNEWVVGRRLVPEDQCTRIEQLVEGTVTCEELRRDIVWRRLDDAAWPWHPEGRPLKDVHLTAEKPKSARTPKTSKRTGASHA